MKFKQNYSKHFYCHQQVGTKFKRVRGGACYNDGRFTRCAYRNGYTPGARSDYVGFRCCFSPLL